jgi:TolB-like protein
MPGKIGKKAMTTESNDRLREADEAAARWFVEIDRSTDGEIDETAFAHWVAEPGNAAALARCELAAHLAHRLQTDQDNRWAFDDAALVAIGRRDRVGTAWPRQAALAWGMALLAVVIAAAAFLTRPPTAPPGDAPVEPDARPLAIDQAAAEGAGARFALIAEQVPVIPVVELPGEIAVDARSIAVLPFVLAGTPSNDPPALGALVESLHGRLVEDLRSLPGFYVIARESVLPYSDVGLMPAEIAAQLGVRGIVRGRVREAEGGLQVTLELVDAASGELLLNEEYEQATDLRTLQDSIAFDIAMALADPSRIDSPSTL